MKDGLQEAQARFYVQNAVLDQRARLGAALADKAQAVLDRRVRRMMWADVSSLFGDQSVLPPYGHYWLAGDRWPNDTQELYDLAAEVAKALGDASPRS